MHSIGLKLSDPEVNIQVRVYRDANANHIHWNDDYDEALVRGA